MSLDRCVALPRSAQSLSAVCDSGISSSFSLRIFVLAITDCVKMYISARLLCSYVCNFTSFICKHYFLSFAPIPHMP